MPDFSGLKLICENVTIVLLGGFLPRGLDFPILMPMGACISHFAAYGGLDFPFLMPMGAWNSHLMPMGA
jgi:hypothetical protein